MAIKVFAEAYPTPYMERDQTGIVVIQVTNVSNAVIGTVAKPLRDVSVTVNPPGEDGQPDASKTVLLQAPTTIAAEGEAFAFMVITPAMLAVVGPTVEYVYFNVVAVGKSDGIEKSTTVPYIGLELAA